MRIPLTPEMKEYKKIYEPYLDGCHLKENAPDEAKEALEKVMSYYKEARQKEIDSWFDWPRG